MRDGIEDYRLTDADENRMRVAIRNAYKEYRPKPRLTGEVVDTLERIGAHSIGCSVFDLRECERQWIVNEIGELDLGLR